MNRTIRLPPSLRKLQRPWFKEKIDPEIEGYIRFNAKLSEESGNRFGVTAYMSGGADTVVTMAVDKKTGFRMKRLIEREYFQDAVDPKKSILAAMKLEEELQRRGVELNINLSDPYYSFSNDPLERAEWISHELFELALLAINILPQSHFGTEHFKELKIGGWGGGAAKCSEYDSPIVHMFSFVLHGSKRNFLALLLHEIGHSFERILSKKDRRDLQITFEDTDARLGVDYLTGESDRIRYQWDFNECVAENYMHYVTQGSRLLDFVSSLKGRDRDAWEEILNIYAANFDFTTYI